MFVILDFGSITDWITAGTGLIAVIFAIKGYNQLINGQIDVQKQVSAAIETATSMERLVNTWLIEQRARKEQLKPRFHLANQPAIENNGRLLLIPIFNIGNTATINVRVYSLLDKGYSLLRNDWNYINSKDSCKIQVIGEINDLAVTEEEPLLLDIWLTDSYGYRYYQEIYVFFNDRHEINARIMPPEETDLKNEPVPVYDGS